MTDKASILIVDDEENLRRTLAIILKRAGYEVMTAGTVKEAHQYLVASSYDLTFLDLKLPDESGLTLLPELRSLYPDMPVVILTAQDRLDGALEAIRKGARDYLLKPIDPPLIIKRVEEILAESNQPPSFQKRYTQIKGMLKELRSEDTTKPSSPDKPGS